MRNLKKILALALVFAMAFTFTAGAAFADVAEIGKDYVDDVNMLVELGVISGYPDGSFKPQANITRAEFAKMAYTLKYGSDTDGNLFAAQKSDFADVEGVAEVAWAKGYINFCANQKIVSGKSATKFDPQANITVAEATKMILVIMGVNPEKEGLVGPNWTANTVALGMQLGVYDGWAGDPTQLATRELVAKLMKNAIFSPVFEYSAITGTGSQYNFEGVKNITLGEKTMDLKTVTGIVIANERYALLTDAEGEDLEIEVAATGVDSGESEILYEAKTRDGDIIVNTLTIDRALPDSMLGYKVNVFFKADMASSAEYSYKNVEVIGDVLVNSDTVAYEVSSADVALMPNATSTSQTEIVPYIGFTVDGVEKQIKAPSEAGRLPKNSNAFVEGIGEFYTNYAYVSTETLRGDGTPVLEHPAAGDEFFSAMGTGSLANYRFVSVDGGRTYSYMFKMVSVDNAKYSAVTNYSEAKGTIYLSGLGTVDLEDCVINGTVATDDYVVYYRENGKVYIEKAEVITGAVESFNEDGSVVIGGKTYYADETLCVEYTDNGNDLFNYYDATPSALNASTKYYVYGNIILQIEPSDAVSSVENYAVITNSFYDANLDVAYVKLAFADNTTGTYKIGKFYTKYASQPNNAANDRAMDYADNARFGWVVKYSIRNDGTVDLSGQDFKKLINEDNAQVPAMGGTANIVNKQFANETGSYYGYNENAIVFVLHGKLDVANTDADYTPVTARAYKLANVIDADGDVIPGLEIEGTPAGALSSAVINKNGYERTVVAAAMTIGDSASIGYKSSDNLGYVVSAKQLYNVATGNYYAAMKLISEDGLISANTVENVTNLYNVEVLSAESGIGAIDAVDSTFPAGSFVCYSLDADGKIATIDITGRYAPGVAVGSDPADYTDDAGVRHIYSGEQSGLFAINVAATNADRLSYYNTVDAITVVNGKPVDGSLQSILFSEDGYDIITIDDGAYAGSDLIKLPARLDDDEGIKAFHYNAVMQVEEGEVIRVFSFVDMQKSAYYVPPVDNGDNGDNNA